MICKHCGYKGPFPKCPKKDKDGTPCGVAYCPRCGSHAFEPLRQGLHDKKGRAK
jgi:hypothetical protein